jgi:hypothetical protein
VNMEGGPVAYKVVVSMTRVQQQMAMTSSSMTRGGYHGASTWPEECDTEPQHGQKNVARGLNLPEECGKEPQHGQKNVAQSLNMTRRIWQGASPWPEECGTEPQHGQKNVALILNMARRMWHGASTCPEECGTEPQHDQKNVTCCPTHVI